MKKIILFALFFCSFLPLYSQMNISKDTILNRDSLVKINELVFENSKEKASYYKFVKSKDNNDALNLLLLGKNENFNTDSIIKIIEKHAIIIEGKMKKLSEKKKIKFFYTYVHDIFFDKYVELALFSDIFTNKEYNCLSASILYGMFLDKLNIPYEARMSNTHVYLVVYPKTLNIVLETTNPISQINKITDDSKRQYVSQMRSLKIIGADEFEKLSVDDLFSKYFYKEDAANMYEMIGAHYQNRAAAYLLKFDYHKAYYLLMKAHVINPSYKTIFSILQTGVAVLQQNAFKKSEDAEILGLLSRFTSYGLTTDMILSDFGSLTKVQIIEAEDTTLYTNSFNGIIQYITDSSLKANITEVYYDAMCRYYFKKSKMDKSLYFAEKMFSLNPNNSENEDVLVEVFTNYLEFSEIDFNSTQVYKKIDDYIKIKPSLSANRTIGLLRISCWLELATTEYNKGNMAEGDKYLTEFEKIVTRELANLYSTTIQDVYVSGSFYYYKKYNNKKAKEYIERGLKILPENYELKRRLNSF